MNKRIIKNTASLTAAGLFILSLSESPLYAQSSATKTNTATETQPAVSAAVVNQLQSEQEQQSALIQKLLGRLEQLEQKGAEESQHTDSLKKAHQEEVQQLLGRINELEGKVQSLESGRVLPQIEVSPQDGPTVAELDQKIRIMERNNELADEAAEARASQQPRLSVGSSGFIVSSADTNFVLKLKGLIQADSRTFFDDSSYTEGNDSFLIRRARPILEGTVWRDFDFLLVTDFAGSTTTLIDAWLNYRYEPAFQLRIGKMKGPVGLENLQSDSAGSFNERSMVSDFIPTRSIGVQIWGDVSGGLFSYAAGVFNNSGDARNPGNSDFNDSKEYAGRLFLQPFKKTELSGLKGLGFGVGGSYADLDNTTAGLPATTGGSLSGYFTAGQQQFFAYNPLIGTVVADGRHWRVSPQAYYYYGPFGLMGEYAISDQEVANVTGSGPSQTTLASDKLRHTSWQVSAQWVLTGEPAAFTGINPKRPFDPRKGNWGAWQLVGRYGQLNIDDDAFNGFSNPDYSASKATAWSVGLNWWLNNNIRVLTSYSHTTFDGGGSVNSLVPGSLNAPSTVTAQDESVFFTRIQLAF